MCGYIGRITDSPGLQALFEALGLGDLLQPFVADYTMERFYPAFGKDTSKVIRGLLIEEHGQKKLIDATWGFNCKAKGPTLTIGRKPIFNARDLTLPYWSEALSQYRAVVIATELGESQPVGKGKHRYLMQSQAPFLLGALYRPFPNGCYSCATITRDPHPKFTPYHKQAFPLFLPAHDPHFIHRWLDSHTPEHPDITQLLAAPMLFPDLTVTQVKSFKSAQRLGETTLLSSDVTP